MNGIWLALIKDIVVPEVMAFVNKKITERGTPPTDAEVIAHLRLEARDVMAEGRAFLASKGVTSPSPQADGDTGEAQDD